MRIAKEKNTRSSQGILWEDVLLEVNLTRAVLRSSNADIWEKLVTPPTPMQQCLPQQEIQRTGLSYSLPV
jgi:hypothetical protein